jgi:cyclopropane-fatty-acyl-phospholipid synthase
MSEFTRKQRFGDQGEGAALWHAYARDEEVTRTNVHYERPPEFFTLITGGAWKVYSCNLWDGAATETESQERKLDLLAEMMELRPGMRVLDVGCGWGGPLIYLAKNYGVTGVGAGIAPTLIDYARSWVAREDVPVEIVGSHWADLEDAEGFDAVYTDEVIVHFNDLEGFFRKAASLLRPGGVMVNKEVHFASSVYQQPNRLMRFINEIYGETGNYRTLAEELALLDRAGFALKGVRTMPLSNYQATAAAWLANMDTNRQRLEELCGTEYFKQFRTYVRLVQRLFASGTMSVDVVASRVAPAAEP